MTKAILWVTARQEVEGSEAEIQEQAEALEVALKEMGFSISG